MSITAEYMVEISWARSEIIGRICPWLQFFQKRNKKIYAVVSTCIPTPTALLMTLWPWLLTFSPQGQCTPSDCRGVCLLRLVLRAQAGFLLHVCRSGTHRQSDRQTDTHTKSQTHWSPYHGGIGWLTTTNITIVEFLVVVFDQQEENPDSNESRRVQTLQVDEGAFTPDAAPSGTVPCLALWCVAAPGPVWRNVGLLEIWENDLKVA